MQFFVLLLDQFSVVRNPGVFSWAYSWAIVA